VILETFHRIFQQYTPTPSEIDLGDFFPLQGDTLEELSGCKQEFRRQYPLVALGGQLQTQLNQLQPQDVVVYMVYLNNLAESLDFELINQLNLLLGSLNQPYIRLYNVLVGNSLYPSDLQIGWRSLEDDSFEDEIESRLEDQFPFMTTDFVVGETSITLPALNTLYNPQYFKICQLTNQGSRDAVLLQVEVDNTLQFIPPQTQYPWGQQTDPALYLDLPVQDRVEAYTYQQSKVVIQYEVCTRFCALPFRRASGQDEESWLGNSSCQWGNRNE
jgi:hypothetical protein